jgi:hypothetical protein
MMHIKKLLLITAITFPIFVSANDDCQSTKVMATYSIEEATKDIVSSKKSELILLRTKNSAFHISNKTVATKWTRLPKDNMKKTSYFIDDKRAIEYEVVKNNTNQAWDYHAQLLHPKFKEQATLIEKTGVGCELLEHYQQKTITKTVDIWWLPEQKIMKRITSEFADRTVNWQLTDATHNEKVIQQQLDILSAYQSTDFADIGDNESDPFFRKMINLGFIEHSASGFYDSNGNALSSSHQH